MLNDAASQSVSQPASQPATTTATDHERQQQQWVQQQQQRSECATLIQLRQTNCKSLGKCETQSRVIYCLCYLLFFLLLSPAVCLPASHCQLRLHHRHSSPGPLNYLTDLICLGCSLFTIVSEPRIYVYCGLQLLRVSVVSVSVCVDVHVSVSQAVAVSLPESLSSDVMRWQCKFATRLKRIFHLVVLIIPSKMAQNGKGIQQVWQSHKSQQLNWVEDNNNNKHKEHSSIRCKLRQLL